MKPAKANEFTVKRIDEDNFELWRDGDLQATLTREEAWPIMIGRVHPLEALNGRSTEGEEHDGSDRQ